MRAPFLAGTVFCKGRSSATAHSGPREGKTEDRQSAQLLAERLGMTWTGEAWFQVRRKEGGEPSHHPPPGAEAPDLPPTPLSARECVALAACTSPALLHPLQRPLSIPLSKRPPCTLFSAERSSYVPPLCRLSPWKSAFTFIREISFSPAEQGERATFPWLGNNW